MAGSIYPLVSQFRMQCNSVKGGCATIECLVDEYIGYITNVKARSQNTVAAYCQDLKCFLEFLSSSETKLCDVKIRVTQQELLSYLDYLRVSKQLKPASVRRRVLTLRGFCQWLIYARKMESNPFDEVSLDLKVPKRLPRPIDSFTLHQLISSAGDHKLDKVESKKSFMATDKVSQKETTILVMKLMLVTGIRVSEVCAIRLIDITSDAKTIRIVGKGDKERLVYVENISLSNMLSNYRRGRANVASESDCFFVNSRGTKLTPQVVRKRIKSICEAEGTKNRPTPHQFRHSAATLLIENGVDIRVVQRLLGHASISTTELYTQVSDVSLRESLRRADVLMQYG